MTPPEKGRYTYEQHFKNELGEGDTTLDMEIQSIEDVGSSTYSVRELRTWRVGGLKEETVQLWRNDGVYLHRRDTNFKSLGNTQQRRCTFEPPLPRLQYPIQIGSSWSYSARCDDDEFSNTHKVLKRESVTVGNQEIETFVVRRETTGSDYKVITIDWFSPEYRLVVRIEIERDSGSETEEKLVSLRPR